MQFLFLRKYSEKTTIYCLLFCSIICVSSNHLIHLKFSQTTLWNIRCNHKILCTVTAVTCVRDRDCITIRSFVWLGWCVRWRGTNWRAVQSSDTRFVVSLRVALCDRFVCSTVTWPVLAVYHRCTELCVLSWPTSIYRKRVYSYSENCTQCLRFIIATQSSTDRYIWYRYVGVTGTCDGVSSSH